MSFSIKKIGLIVSSLLILFAGITFAEPENLSIEKKRLIAYHDSGKYERDIQQVINEAKNYMARQAAAHKNTNKLALVLDIDETSLSNYKQIVARDFSGQPDLVKKDIMKAEGQAIKPTLALYNYALAHGIKVFFVTGRREFMRAATIANLHQAGYRHWTKLILRPNASKAHSIIPFKSGARKKIESQGYLILASIGDQMSDIKGGYEQRGFKLPNPYYFLP